MRNVAVSELGGNDPAASAVRGAEDEVKGVGRTRRRRTQVGNKLVRSRAVSGVCPAFATKASPAASPEAMVRRKSIEIAQRRRRRAHRTDDLAIEQGLAEDVQLTRTAPRPRRATRDFAARAARFELETDAVIEVSTPVDAIELLERIPPRDAGRDCRTNAPSITDESVTA